MKYALLALLAAGATHGYELKRAIEDQFGSAWPSVNIGQIYSTLGRLERDGLVISQQIEQRGRPDKKVYELTAQGRLRLEEWMQEPAEPTRLRDDFFLKFVLANATAVTDANELLERQRAEALQSLRDLGDVLNDVDGSVESVLLVEAAALHLQADLRWLDRCEQYLTERSHS